MHSPTGYYAHYTTVTNAWQLFKVVAGVSTQIGSDVAQVLVVDQAYTCILAGRGSNLRVYVDAAIIINQTDATITAAGRGGLRMSGAATSTIGVHLDNYTMRQGDNAYVQDVPNGGRIYHDDADYTGTNQRVYSNDLLPLPPGSNTIRITDDDGNIGTVDVTFVVSPGYL